MKVNKERIIYLDVLRVLACMMVVLMHAPMPGVVSNGTLLASISFLCAPCIGLFFMVSGALLLPTDLSTGDFLRKRLNKVLIPTIVWTLIYVALHIAEEDISVNQLPRVLLSTPFSAQGEGILWFMYTLAGLYLLTPVISPYLAKACERELLIIVVLWGVTLFFPILKMVLTVDEGNTGILYYFGGYAGYYVLGYYLHRFRPKVSVFTLIALGGIPLAVAVICRLSGAEVDFYSLFWYLGIFVVMLSTAIFLAAMGINWKQGRLSRMLANISDCTFGIYLAHILVMRHFLWRLPWMSQMGGVSQIILTFTLTLILSLIIVFLLARIPGGSLIVGIKNRK